jgi:hypothetical protein
VYLLKFWRKAQVEGRENCMNKSFASAFAIATVPVLVACSASDGSTTGPCAQRSGTYQFDFTERSGTCGAMTESISTLDAQPTSPPSPCTSGEIRYSSDNCEVTNVDVVCPQDGVATGATSTMNGKYDWAKDGSAGAGVMAVAIKDSSGLVICQSSYDVTAKRL